MRHGNLFVISGPSGAGKGTLVAHLLSKVPDAWVSVSVTTRKPRSGEEEGVNYFFLSEEEFDHLVVTGGLLEWAQVHDCRYGTPKEVVQEHIAAGQQVILEIDVQGAFQVRKQFPEAKLIFIEPPTLDILRQRLCDRGTESSEMVEKRMKTAELELSRKMEYDIRLVNDELDVAVAELVSYINTQASTR